MCMVYIYISLYNICIYIKADRIMFQMFGDLCQCRLYSQTD